jgi:hypothetical protein
MRKEELKREMSNDIIRKQINEIRYRMRKISSMEEHPGKIETLSGFQDRLDTLIRRLL